MASIQTAMSSESHDALSVPTDAKREARSKKEVRSRTARRGASCAGSRGVAARFLPPSQRAEASTAARRTKQRFRFGFLVWRSLLFSTVSRSIDLGGWLRNTRVSASSEGFSLLIYPTFLYFTETHKLGHLLSSLSDSCDTSRSRICTSAIARYCGRPTRLESLKFNVSSAASCWQKSLS